MREYKFQAKKTSEIIVQANNEEKAEQKAKQIVKPRTQEAEEYSPTDKVRITEYPANLEPMTRQYEVILEVQHHLEIPAKTKQEAYDKAMAQKNRKTETGENHYEIFEVECEPND